MRIGYANVAAIIAAVRRAEAGWPGSSSEPAATASGGRPRPGRPDLADDQDRPEHDERGADDTGKAERAHRVKDGRSLPGHRREDEDEEARSNDHERRARSPRDDPWSLLQVRSDHQRSGPHWPLPAVHLTADTCRRGPGDQGGCVRPLYIISITAVATAEFAVRKQMTRHVADAVDPRRTGRR